MNAVIPETIGAAILGLGINTGIRHADYWD